MLLVRNVFGQSGRGDVRQPVEDCLAPDTGDLTVSIEVRLRATVLNAAFADNLVNRPRLLGGETTAPRARGGAACQCEMQPLAGRSGSRTRPGLALRADSDAPRSGYFASAGSRATSAIA